MASIYGLRRLNDGCWYAHAGEHVPNVFMVQAGEAAAKSSNVHDGKSKSRFESNGMSRKSDDIAERAPALNLQLVSCTVR
eukprot:6676791-Alexandrium_andersonii.AAC.1